MDGGPDPGRRSHISVASAAYRERAEGRSTSDAGRGVQWEARLIRDVYYSDQYALDRFVPVVLPGQSAEGVPDFLAPCSVHRLLRAGVHGGGAEPLLRLLTGQPGWTEPPLGVTPVLEQHSSGCRRCARRWFGFSWDREATVAARTKHYLKQ